MSLRTALLLLFSIAAASCGSTPMMQLDLQSDPVGARVYVSRRGHKSVVTRLGPIQGNVKAEDLEEDFVLIGTSPMVYSSPLKEFESDATIMGFGGQVVLRYKEAVLRFEKPGHATVERHVRFEDGEMIVQVEMPESESSENGAAVPSP